MTLRITAARPSKLEGVRGARTAASLMSTCAIPPRERDPEPESREARSCGSQERLDRWRAHVHRERQALQRAGVGGGEGGRGVLWVFRGAPRSVLVSISPRTRQLPSYGFLLCFLGHRLSVSC